MKSALLALAAAIAIIALSDIGAEPAAGVSAGKADRMAAPYAAAAAGASAGFQVDAAAQTTTVERGAATPLSPESPFRGGK